MAAESLREELMGLAGVADVEVDEGADSPSGVRVRLEPDADARLIGVEVQRILASHGLRSRITAQDEHQPVPATAPEPLIEPAPRPVPVVEAAPQPEPAPEPVPAPVPPTPPPPIVEPAPFPAPLIPPPPLTPPPVAPVSAPPTAPPSREPAADSPGLASISVEESRDGVSVTATATDGRTSTQHGEATEGGMYEAAVAAVGILADGSPPGLISITPLDAGEAQAIAVVLERADGSKAAGAAIVKVGAAYAVGRATWSALRGA
ncbi:MAG: hypothetical protein KJ698_09225 [Actinobacteria bacterium]|nr:hypothetical protein [Actinomycetota bacterium]MBU1494562.1 hypothetical protein [Actinomycetota bacterium]